MTSEGGGIDYSAVLADLEAKRDTLDKAIMGIRAMLGLSSASGPAGTSGSGAVRSPDTPVSVGRHEFVGMSTPEATKKYLQKVKRLHLAAQSPERHGGGVLYWGRGRWGIGCFLVA